MKLEELKNDIPETPEFIHRMIQNEVEKQLQDTKTVDMQMRKVKKWTGARVAATVAVCVLAASTMAYAGVRLYHMFSEKQGTYSTVTGMSGDGGTGKISLPEKIHDIDISAGYIPEGMEWTDKSHLEYPEHEHTGGFSFGSVLLDEDDLGKTVQDQHVMESEERTFGNYEGVYLKYNDLAEDGSYKQNNQRIYLLCPELYRVITIYIGGDVTKEDAIRVAENLEITENDTMIETAGMYTWSEIASQEEASGEESGEEALVSVEERKLPVHQIGDAFDMPVIDENGGENSQVSACVDAVLVEDNLKLLDQNHVPQEWTQAVGADGKIVDNTLSYIQSGDGVDTVDRVVKTESVKQKLVYVTVTYTNKTEKEISHMPYLGTLMLMNHKDGMYQIYKPDELSGEGYDRVIWDGVADTAEMTYYSVTEDYGNGGNYISSLKPGESVQVDMAWIVNENELDHMYLNLNSDGGAYEFSDAMLKSGVVDICQ